MVSPFDLRRLRVEPVPGVRAVLAVGVPCQWPKLQLQPSHLWGYHDLWLPYLFLYARGAMATGGTSWQGPPAGGRIPT